MDIQQTVDLTYSKVDEIDKKVNRVLNKSSSTDFANIETKVTENSTKLTEIDTKIDETDANLSELTTKTNTIDENTTSIKSDVSNVKTSVETIVTQTEKLANMNNNITTVNSNTATTNNTVNIIKNNIDIIKNTIPSKSYNNEVMQKLDEILKSISQNLNEDTFVTDPYKLDMEYTGKIETDGNPNDYDYIELTDFTAPAYFLPVIAYCESEKFSYKFTMKFEILGVTPINFATNFQTTTHQFYKGKQTYNLEGTDIDVVDNKIVFNYWHSSTRFHVDYLKLEIWGKNVKFMPKRKKYKINYSYDKVIISKLENNKGYYLISNKKNAITPNLLKQEYVLDEENVFDYEYTYDNYNFRSQMYSIVFYKQYLTNTFQFGLSCNDSYKYLRDGITPAIAFSPGTCDLQKFHGGAIYLKKDCKSAPFFFECASSYTSETRQEIPFQNEHAVDVNMVLETTRFDATEKTAYIITIVNGTNYFYKNDNCNVEIGFGSNVTAFYDKINPLKVYVYMNDCGYCVKSTLLMNSDYTAVTLINQKIIGTYDTYFETPSNVYIIEKNGNLYAFDSTKNITDNLPAKDNTETTNTNNNNAESNYSTSENE